MFRLTVEQSCSVNSAAAAPHLRTGNREGDKLV